jgi:hypothetical protein
MSRHRFSLTALLPVLSLSAGCVGTTGGDLFTFSAFAAGPEDAEAAPGGSYSFTSGRGYTVSLTRAKLHIGAVYLNKSVPSSVATNTSCALAGIYTAEVTTGLDVDVLSSSPQPFPKPGFATSERAPTGEIWLNGADINSPSDPTVILDMAGTAEKDGVSYPFDGQVTISDNRASPADDPAQPGEHPICKQRIVTPIAIDVQPTAGGRLLVRVDPRGWFGNVDFVDLERVSDAPPLYRIADSSENPPSKNLYIGLRSSSGVYSFHWQDETP